MILIYKDKNGKWHLVKSLGKAGLTSISIKPYCEQEEGNDNIVQVPDAYLDRICDVCKTIVKSLES